MRDIVTSLGAVLVGSKECKSKNENQNAGVLS